jgi:hypothetical protein
VVHFLGKLHPKVISSEIKLTLIFRMIFGGEIMTPFPV